MKKLTRGLIALVCVLALATPDLAMARAGGGKSSMGSRGSRTYQSTPSYQAAPVERSATPRPSVNQGPAAGSFSAPPRPAPAAAPAAPPPFAAPAAASTGGSFLRGMAGGFLGAGLYSLLFGHSPAAAAPAAPAAGAPASGEGVAASAATPAAPASSANSAGNSMGGLLQILLLAGLGYLGYRWYRQRQADQNGTAQTDAPFAGSDPHAEEAVAQEASSQGAPLTLTDADYQAFQELHAKIQAAWGVSDLFQMRSFVTDEMLTYFNETLADQASRNLVNKVEQVKFLAGNLVESWSEAGGDYATVRVRWSSIDYTVRTDRAPTAPDYIESGSPTQAVEATEIWTFARPSAATPWRLSAIQQVV